MSTTVSTSFVTLYDAEVKAAYQREQSYLGSLLRVRPVSNANIVTFQRLGTASTATKGRHADIVTSDIVHTTTTVTLSDYYSGEYVDALDELKTNVALRAEYARAIAAALQRRKDSIIATAWSTGATDFADTDGALSKSRVLAVRQQLLENDVPMGNIFGVITPASHTALMAEDAFTSSDYTGLRQFDSNAQTFNWLGIQFVVFNGLPAASGSYKWAFFGDKSASGLGVGAEPQLMVNYVPEKDSTLIAGKLSMGATVIDPRGIYRLEVTD